MSMPSVRTRTLRALTFTAMLSSASASCLAQQPPASALPSDQEISDSYIYLLGRLLVLRQQQLDFKEGFKWNQLVHRKPGEVAWPNPNLDVAYSEAWVAVDEKSCALVTVPKITGRYYTVQFLNGWGETVANINERVFPAHPDGQFAMCLKGAEAKLPATVQRIDVPVKYMRVLSRVELGADWNQAVALQKKFAIRATGKPALPSIPKTVMFEMNKLPGAEAFVSADAALDSEVDINPGMEKLQASTRAIAKAVKNPAERQRIDQVVRGKAFADIKKALPTVGGSKVENGWVLPSTSGVYGDNWLVRTLINYGGIWANVPEEVIYYKAFADVDGVPLSGDHAYSLRFTKEQLPAQYATHFWSVIAVDSVERRVLPNPLKRYLLNKESKLQYAPDGSLTLYFGDKKPSEAPQANWLPTPKGVPYSLTFRFYRPKGAVAERTYFPPKLDKQ
ncbi:DUF1214 domain-containing protein [Variovorax sp. YR216]|uniref:DUF1214 domain-containing protein n=1 Tax=Variovorax sp. YR216 TaxID=1882828 RepID=UPI00089BD9D5|nr:DUF1214 domain-containing protein [Variovorax sp. YR216]SEB24636.1 Uncharacterized conserved protein [Variovorax sp. YR216]